MFTPNLQVFYNIYSCANSIHFFTNIRYLFSCYLFCLQDSDESVEDEDEDMDMDSKVSSLSEEDEKNLADNGITSESHNHTVCSKIIYEIIIISFLACMLKV